MRPVHGEHLTPTIDPTCWIETADAERVVYRTTTGERWVIEGVCNRCGACEWGGADHLAGVVRFTGPVGTPGACTDTRYGQRLDNPVRPELTRTFPSCSLTGHYLPPVLEPTALERDP